MNPIDLQDEKHASGESLFLIEVGSNSFVSGTLHVKKESPPGKKIVSLHIETNGADMHYVGNTKLFAAVRNLLEQLVDAAPNASNYDHLRIDFSECEKE